MNDSVYRFAACEVSITRREVVLQGQRQVLEPRPFDLLVYLIEQRHRVVSKGELLQQLWQHEFVSDSVIARAVMKARQAIGDTGKEPALIRTVHRMGYRFIGELEDDGGTAAVVPPAAPAPPAGTVSLALLPFDNRTGQAELDWIELGLMSLSAKALSTDPRLAVASTPSLLTALGTLNGQAASEERVRVVQELLGVRHVVHVTVSREGGQYRLDYGIDFPPLGGAKSLLAAEVTQLGHQLAREVEVALFPEETAVSIAFDSSDPLANQALARAMQAVGEQKWKIAANLLQIVLDIEPDNLSVQLERARVLAQLGDDEASRMAERLLAHADSAHDTLLAAMAHEVFSGAYFSKRLLEPAERHAQEALRLAGNQAPADWLQKLLAGLSSIALLRRDFQIASEALDRAQRLCEQTGNQVQQTLLLNNRAVAAARMGDPVLACHFAHEAAELARSYRLTSNLVSSSVNLAQINLALGLMQAAAEHGEEALAAARTLGHEIRIMAAGETSCRVYRQLRHHKEAGRVLAMLETLDGNRLPASNAYLLAVRGQFAALSHDHASAAGHLREAVAIYRSTDGWLNMHDTLPWLFTSLVHAGHADEAGTLHREMRSLPALHDDPELEAAWLHARAADAHLHRDAEVALDSLLVAADTAPMGLWRAYACMDAAWLHLERGNVAAARRLLRDVGPWLSEHPAGMTVDARLKFAGGHFAAAHEAQQRYARTIQCEMPAYHAELAAIYSAAVGQAPSSVPALPTAPLLPTAI